MAIGELAVVHVFEQVKLGNRLRLITYGTAKNDRKFVELQRCIMIGAVLFASNYAYHCTTGAQVWMLFALIT